LRVEASSICGTDARIIRKGHRKLSPGQSVVLGHEFAGVIEELGPGVRGYQVGQRVGVAPNIGCGECEQCRAGRANMCPTYSAFGINMDGGHARYVVIPEAAVDQGNVMPLPENVSFEQAALAEPLSCVINSLRECRIASGESVLVFGCGPMGLLHLLLARARGAASVWMVDAEASKIERAAALGADRVVCSSREDVGAAVTGATGGRGLDVVVTACPVPEVQEKSLELLAPFGRACFFGGLPPEGAKVRLDSNLIHYRNLTVTGVTGGCNRDLGEALGLIADGRVRVEDVVSDRLEASAMEEAFRRALGGRALKVVIGH
jgi:threonine dehydrogenase-like Zn-dependent dehydrogenase